jgi:hypothetical protein
MGNTVYVQGSYVDVHDNEVVNLSIDKATVSVQGEQLAEAGEVPAGVPAGVPAVLADSELWAKVKAAGMVNEDGMPTVSRPEAALMANALAERLGIAHKWKMFETLWHRKNMRGDYNTALNQRKSLDFQDRLREILD